MWARRVFATAFAFSSAFFPAVGGSSAGAAIASRVNTRIGISQRVMGPVPAGTLERRTAGAAPRWYASGAPV